jgi:hypothetical protein
MLAPKKGTESPSTDVPQARDRDSRAYAKKFENAWVRTRNELEEIGTIHPDIEIVEQVARIAFTGREVAASRAPLEEKIHVIAYLVLRNLHPEEPVLKKFKRLGEGNVRIGSKLFKDLKAFVDDLPLGGTSPPHLAESLRSKFAALGFDARSPVLDSFARICDLVAKECKFAPPCFITAPVVYSLLKAAAEVDPSFARTEAQVGQLFNMSPSRLSLNKRGVEAFLAAHPELAQIVQAVIAGAQRSAPGANSTFNPKEMCA